MPKARHSKTRSGCITCRRRHIKCDEGKPECRRCAKSKRRCEGYNTPVPWMFQPASAARAFMFQPPMMAIQGSCKTSREEHLAQSPTRTSTATNPGSAFAFVAPELPRSPCPVPGSKVADRQNFWQYLQLCRSTTEVAADDDRDFFCNVIPQASLEYPALRSAILCFACYLASLVDPDNAAMHQLSAEVQYNKLLKAAASYRPTSPSSDWIGTFLVSMLLRCLETYRNDYGRAQTHLQGAIGILQDKMSSSPYYSSDPCIEQIIRRVHAKAARVGNQKVLMDRSPLSAYPQFNTVIHNICERLNNAVDSSFARPSRIQSCIDQLDDCVARATGSSNTSRATPSQVYLQIQYQVCRIVLSTLDQPLDQYCTSLDDGFQELLDLCLLFHQVSLLQGKTTSSAGLHVRLAFGMEFISSILFIATTCRIRHIRLSAISLLRVCFRQEWHWDSFQAAQIAEYLLNEEEQRPSVRMPFQNPIAVSAGFYQEKHESVSQFKRPSWVRLCIRRSSKICHKWLPLEKPQPGVGITAKLSQPAKPVLCYEVPGPFWPSNVWSIAQAYNGNTDCARD